MSTTEITTLRKSGKLLEALQEAEKKLNEQPHDISVGRCAAWVYVDLMKNNATNAKYAAFQEYFNKFVDLDLPESETILYDNVLWATRAFVADYSMQNDNSQNLNAVFATLRKLRHIDVNSKAYRALLSATLKVKKWNGIFDFIQWWNLDNLRKEDYSKTIFDSKELQSVAETAYNAACRYFIDYNDNRVFDFLKVLAQVSAEHPEYQYLPWYQTKLLFKIGDKKTAIETLKVFARKKSGDFWIWQLLGDEEENLDYKTMFYVKAASCKGKDEMLVRTLEKAGCFLYNNGHPDMGKYLIEKYIAIKKKTGYHISANVLQLIQSTMWNSITAQWNNEFAKHQIVLAEEFLFGKTNKVKVLVTNVNTDKKSVGFITEDKKEGFFFIPKKSNVEVNKHDVLILSVSEIPEHGSTQVRNYTKINDINNASFFKPFKGCLKTVNSGAGFVNNIFISPNLILNFNNGQFVEGIAALSFDKKKQRWAWSAINISEHDA